MRRDSGRHNDVVNRTTSAEQRQRKRRVASQLSAVPRIWALACARNQDTASARARAQILKARERAERLRNCARELVVGEAAARAHVQCQ
jgi:hypothetical protein